MIYFLLALARLSETDLDVLVDFGDGLLDDVGAFCAGAIEAAILLTALLGLRVLTPPGSRDVTPLAPIRDPVPPCPAAMRSAAVLPRRRSTVSS